MGQWANRLLLRPTTPLSIMMVPAPSPCTPLLWQKLASMELIPGAIRWGTAAAELLTAIQRETGSFPLPGSGRKRKMRERRREGGREEENGT